MSRRRREVMRKKGRKGVEGEGGGGEELISHTCCED
jgi:hypothetical protein